MTTHPPQPSLIALSEAATPGPWKACGQDRGGCSCGLIWSEPLDAALAQTCLRDTDDAPNLVTGDQVKHNAVFIAALVNHFRATQSRPEAELPELPTPAGPWHATSDYEGYYTYTADQMRAYGQQCAATRPDTSLSKTDIDNAIVQIQVWIDHVAANPLGVLSARRGVAEIVRELCATRPAEVGGDGHFVAIDKKELAKFIADNMIGFAPKTYSNDRFRLDVEMAVSCMRQLYANPPAPGSEVRP